MTRSDSIGMEIGPQRLRALRFRGRRAVDAMEVEWGAGTPEDSVGAVAERFGRRNRIAVALDASLLMVKRIALPPLPEVQRRQIVALDPERFFPWRGEPLVVGVGHDDLVVAVREAEFDRIADALAALGTVERVEPLPFAVARHLRTLEGADGWAILADPGDRDQACVVCRIQAGRATAIRKLPLVPRELVDAAGEQGPTTLYLYPWQPALADALSGLGLAPAPLPAPQGGTEAFAGAHGALLGLEGHDGPTLVSTALERRQRGRARRRGALAVISVVTAAVIAIGSAEYRRERSLRDLERRVAQVELQARDVQSLLAEAAVVEREVATLAEVSRERPDPLEVLLLLARLLPADASVRSLHGAGNEWEVDGYARDAATLIPTLEASDRLAGVRFRTATTRIQLGDRDYESYSLAFQYLRPAE